MPIGEQTQGIMLGVHLDVIQFKFNMPIGEQTQDIMLGAHVDVFSVKSKVANW